MGYMLNFRRIVARIKLKIKGGIKNRQERNNKLKIWSKVYKKYKLGKMINKFKKC